jgi:type II secretory pathway component PulF
MTVLSRLRRACSPARLAALSFRKDRADYYEYLADVMEGTGGRKTLRDVFRSDADRYGRRHRRGILSHHWADQHQEVGGDLYETFRGTLPDDDLVLIRMGQRGGAGALEQTLRDVAAVTRVVELARSTFIRTAAVGVVAMLVMVATVLAIPAFTVPRLKQAFGMLPAEFVGTQAARLYRLSDFIEAWALVLAASSVGLMWLTAWSLPNVVGPVRRWLDEHLIWRLYRDFQGIRFLASLATLVKKRGNVSPGLREVLEVQAVGANAWQRWHIEQMIARIDDGQVGSATFDTGVVDRETLWFLTDLIATRGMDDALLRARTRVETRAVHDVARKAAVARWAMLLVAVAILFGILFWHFAVVNEMRMAMTRFYSSR